MLADDDVDRDAAKERRDRGEVDPRSAGDDREQDGREREVQAEQQARRHEQLDRIVQVVAEAVVASPLGHQAQRQLHERAERRLDGADVDRGDAEQEEQLTGSFVRALDQAGAEAALLRNRRSIRAMRPPSDRAW